MGAAIEAEERSALRQEVARFARRTIEPRVERPERPPSPAEVAAILTDADELGLAGCIDEPTGLGVWEELVDASLPGASLETLQQLGRANAAVAFAVHQRGLARAACRLAELPAATLAPLAVAPAGSYGLGRRPVARWLAEVALDDDDATLLGDLFGRAPVRVTTVEHGFAGIVAPVRVGAAVQWTLARREQLAVDLQPHAHGLDELATAAIGLPADSPTSSLVEARARGVFAAVVGAHQLATAAIARGATERSLVLARRYAAERQQGGAFIDRYPAVLELLGSCRSKLVVVDALLERAARTPLDPAGLIAALSLRAHAMPALADAANAALQVFGGIGYMRDLGAEKVVRDVNHLRAIAGPLGELDLIVAEWERVHG